MPTTKVDIFSDADDPKVTAQKPQLRSQAERVFDKFLNARKLALAIGRAPSSVYRWSYPTTKGGTGGLIPSSALPEVFAAAARLGIFISADDLYPGRR